MKPRNSVKFKASAGITFRCINTNLTHGFHKLDYCGPQPAGGGNEAGDR